MDGPEWREVGVSGLELQKGCALFGLSPAPDGALFGDVVVRLSVPGGKSLPFHVFGPGDNVLPVSSARLPGVVSEVLVPSVHTEIHHHPITVFEMERILVDHLRENGL